MDQDLYLITRDDLVTYLQNLIYQNKYLRIYLTHKESDDKYSRLKDAI